MIQTSKIFFDSIRRMTDSTQFEIRKILIRATSSKKVDYLRLTRIQKLTFIISPCVPGLVGEYQVLAKWHEDYIHFRSRRN